MSWRECISRPSRTPYSERKGSITSTSMPYSRTPQTPKDHPWINETMGGLLILILALLFACQRIVPGTPSSLLTPTPAPTSVQSPTQTLPIAKPGTTPNSLASPSPVIVQVASPSAKGGCQSPDG